MTFTYFIYTLLVFLVIVSAKFYEQWLEKNKITSLLASVIILLGASVIIGCRYEVGTDWSNYKAIYESFLGTSISPITFDIGFSGFLEPFFVIYTNLVATTGLSYQFYFTFTYFLMFLCLFQAFRLFPQYLLWGVFFYMTSRFLVSLNILRQYMAVMLLLYTIPFCIENKKIKFGIGFLGSIMFHYSCILSTLIYVLKFKVFKFLESKIISTTLVLTSFFFKNIIVRIVESIIPFMGNEKYMGTMETLDANHADDATGLGAIYIALFSFFVIYYSDKIEGKYKFLYKAYLIGTILTINFTTSVYLGRVAICLTMLQIFILPFIFTYIYRKGNLMDRTIGLMVIMITILQFYMPIANPNTNYAPFLLHF